MGSNGRIINLLNDLWELAIANKLRIICRVRSEWKQKVDITYLTEMWDNRIDKKKLEINISFDEICPWFGFSTIDQVWISDADKLMEAILYNISIYHCFICILHFLYLIFNLAFKNNIELSCLFILIALSSIELWFFQSFIKIHLKSW